MTPEQIIAAARTWVGTPFGHQGRTIGRRADCLAVLVGVGQQCPAFWDYPDPRDYSATPSSAHMARQLATHLDPVPLHQMAPGDVLHLAIKGDPVHLALLTGPDTMIHCLRHYGVREVRLDDEWRDCIRGAYRSRGLV